MVANEVVAVIGLIVGAGTAVNGFLFRQIFNRVGRMEEKLNSTLQHMPEKYKLKSDCHDCEKRITTRISNSEKRLLTLEKKAAARNSILQQMKSAKEVET